MKTESLSMTQRYGPIGEKREAERLFLIVITVPLPSIAKRHFCSSVGHDTISFPLSQ